MNGVIVSHFFALKFGPNNLFTIGLNNQAVHCSCGSPSAGSTGVDPHENLQGHLVWFREHIYQHGPN